MRKIILFVFLPLFAVGALWLYRFYVGSLHYALNPESEVRMTVNIPRGSSASAVADTLSEKGLINSPTVFKFYLKQNDLTDQIKAGRIVLRENFDLKQITEALIEGKSDEEAVTLLEGWTIRQMGEYLESKGLTTAEAFERCAATCPFGQEMLPKGYVEGYLYPDTYFVNLADYSDQTFISRLIDTLDSRLTDEDRRGIKNSGRTLEEVMIMASIVEREERNAKQRPVVAGILWDRLDAGVGLGADATVLYALGRTKGGLTYNDLQTDSPYNTRKYRGLPPTPISNPSISSIRAAIFPEKTDYFYYLHDADGQVHYAKTLDEHNENKRKYL